MVQKSQMRLELLLLISVKGQSDTQFFKLFRFLCAEWKRWRECIQNNLLQNMMYKPKNSSHNEFILQLAPPGKI